MLLLAMIVLAQANPPGFAGGGEAGWVGTGLLGAVLSWLMFVHLPAKDKQHKEMLAEVAGERAAMLTAWANERERDRESRHAGYNSFQKAVSEIVTGHHQELAQIQEAHLRDAEKDRAAFLERASGTRSAIELQTAQLIAAINGSCKYRLHQQDLPDMSIARRPEKPGS